jgi:hypothetical protein
VKRVGREVGTVAALRTQPAGLRCDCLGIGPRGVKHREALGQRRGGRRAGTSAGTALRREGDSLDPAVRHLQRDSHEVAARRAAGRSLEAIRNRLTHVG